MAAPNIRDVGTITGKTARVDLSSTSATVVVNNPAASGMVKKVQSLIVCNDDGANSAEITIGFYPQDDIGGTPVEIVKNVVVPAKSSVVVITDDAPLFLEEDTSLGATASASNDLNVIAAYSEISE